MVIEGGQAGKNRPGIGRYRRCRRIQAREGSNVFNAARIEDDIGRLLHHFLCPCERRSGRKLNNGNQVSLVLLRNETRLRSRELQPGNADRSEEHTSELQSLAYLVCRLLLEKKKNNTNQ